MEAVLAQIFKEKKDDEFVGGLPFYGRKLLGNSVGIGVFLSILYILYALCCLPAQGFNVVSSVGRMAEILTGKTIAVDSLFYYIAGAAIIILTAVIAFGRNQKSLQMDGYDGSGNGSFVYPRGICFDHFEHWTDPIFLYFSIRRCV